MTVRAVLKSASGDRYEYARYYDSPGYFFDASFGRGFTLSEKVVARIALSRGFLRWQMGFQDWPFQQLRIGVQYQFL
jgi:hypothetical protein